MAKSQGSSKKKATKKPASKQAKTTAAKGKAGAKKATTAAKKQSQERAARPAQPAQPPVAVSAPDGAQLPATRGKAGVFGGKKDRGFKPDDQLSLPTGPHFAYERMRTLNPKSYYCAMRWDYHVGNRSPEEGKRWWANKKLVVTNPESGQSVIVRAVDYGPHEATGLDISISPGAAEALGIEVGDEVEVAFADPKAPLGPVA